MRKIFIAFTLVILSTLTFVKSQSECVSLYYIQGESCAEMCVRSDLAEDIQKIVPVEKGNCKDQQYTILDHKENFSFGPFGDYEVSVYKKAENNMKFLSKASSSFGENLKGSDVTVYKITDGLCGELSLSSYIAYFAEKFGGVVEGTCDSIGYKVFDHMEKVSVGPFGDFDVKIFRKE